MARNKLTEKEKLDWNALYEHVKQLLGYDENQSLSREMVLRLKGLLTGKFIENNNIEDNSNYTYETILNTFKYCNPSIQKALKANNFQSEKHKFMYIAKVVENNINDVYLRMKNINKAKEKIEDVDTTIATYAGVEYKSKEKTKDKFDDLW